ncbi:MAG TPA: hypothetical protein VGK99_16900 [Acidobacteriota bacterium]|jgi:hypothetical protein
MYRVSTGLLHLSLQSGRGAAEPSCATKGESTRDLKAIFAFLRTLKPVSHRVDNDEPATYCKLCGQKYGGGEMNRASPN